MVSRHGVRVWLQLIVAGGLLTGIVAVSTADTPNGPTYQVLMVAVDGRQLSTWDGHVTLVVVVTRQDQMKASLVGDRVSSPYLGDPRYRLVTVLNLQQRAGIVLRQVTLAIIRHRLEVEARQLQSRYLEQNLSRSAREDIFLVADFDGTVVSQFGISPNSDEFAILLLDGKGRLVRRWSEPPSSAELATELARAK